MGAVDREHHHCRGNGRDQRQWQRHGETEAAPDTLASVRSDVVGVVARRPGTGNCRYRIWFVWLRVVPQTLVKKSVEFTTGQFAAVLAE